MADQVRHGCTLTQQQTDNAVPVRLSADELAKVKAKAEQKGIGIAALEAGLHQVHPALMAIVREVIGPDRPLV